MLWNGIEAIEKDPEWAKKAFGLVMADGKEAGELDDVIMQNIDDATGAMHHKVVSVLAYILLNGRDKWLDWVCKNQPERIFAWDGTVKTCPPVTPLLESSQTP